MPGWGEEFAAACRSFANGGFIAVALEVVLKADSANWFLDTHLVLADPARRIAAQLISTVGCCAALLQDVAEEDISSCEL